MSSMSFDQPMEKWLPENEFLRDVLAGLLVLGIASAADWVFGFIVWKSILRGAEYVGSRLGMRVALPLWLLSILVLSAVAWIGTLAYRYYLASQREPYEEDFTEAIIDGIHWHWSWEDGEPIDIHPFCPECGIEMDFEDAYHHDTYWTYATCPRRCESIPFIEDSPEHEVIDIIEREIERQVREDEWQDSSEIPSFHLFSDGASSSA